MVKNSKKQHEDSSRYYLRRKERRRSTRMRKPFVIRFRITQPRTHLTTKPKWHMVTAQDLSADGMTFKFDTALALHTLMDIKITFPASTRPIQCVGSVFRVNAFPDSRLHLISVMFTAISHHDKETIQKIATTHRDHLENES